MSPPEPRTALLPARWLLLIHQLPAKPAYARVKLWRRLQAIGAVAVKNAVYALPANDDSQEDFEWLLKEIGDSGGEALLCEARLVDGLTDQEVQALFNAARDADYEALAKDARELIDYLRHKTAISSDARAQLARLKARLAQIVEIDFFGANGRQTVTGLLSALDIDLQEDAMATAGTNALPVPGIEDLKGRVWVTRQGVHIDRIACAWLIRRFIDPDARFGFVPAKGYRPALGELRFDMFEAEFTHEGDHCTFEVLLGRTGLRDRALTAIAQIVHDIDLKDGKFGRSEAVGIAQLIAGIARAHPEDEQRLARGAAVFDDLYESFRRKRG